MTWLWLLLVPLALTVLYIRINDRHLKAIPPNVLPFSPTRCTPESVRKTASRLRDSQPISIAEQIPPKTGRRYIVVGGAGFLGGWIVLKLLERGEDPKRIRILDIRAPTRYDLTTGPACDVAFIPTDVTDAAATNVAVNAPWPLDSENDNNATPDLTVFHTVANIRFFERSLALLPDSARVNIQGTQNVIDAARAAGATALVFTSSASVAVKTARLLLWPWETAPEAYVQVISDETPVPRRHEVFFSNYAVTKAEAERRVCGADKTPTGAGKGVLRTGCIRPGNAIFGPGGDLLLGFYLLRKSNPSWTQRVVQNCVYVENAVIAHLLYEQRLVELSNGGVNPDIGGQAFVVADPGPPQTYGDLYATLGTLTDGETTFPSVSPTGMLLFAHILEWYHLSRSWLLRAQSRLTALLPPLGANIVNLQPSLFNLVSVHLIFDDSRARLPPEKGGLGYKGAWTTLEAAHKTVDDHKANLQREGAKGR
ncbi:3-beta hydroxysteroid dehydrogenase/isomerase family-domain-containing protein [Mycena metata]|uniref:3-beta hydroxysteroid dehydrogenase/isomerase family-domain-containing protein n=1 Tax=Mycena metata TaxID=1033252 RepID=A0AAD7NPT4_9AGAR|nr:3-beta hydroxysteroid dehydrogenase/isomerase family-domain-containing protein [Mycena metata]